MLWGAETILYRVADAVFRPSEFVRAKAAIYSTSRWSTAQYTTQLSVVWVLNVVLYALPLTVTGVGFTSQRSAPAVFVEYTTPLFQSPDSIWQFIFAFGRNSVFFTVASVIILTSFHMAVLITKESRGLMQSFHTVVYTTSAYLAGIFGLLMYLSTTDGLVQTREIVLRLQANAFQAVLDIIGLGIIGIEFSLPASAGPGPIVFQDLSAMGTVLFAMLCLLMIYFLYSVYLGARLNHRMDRVSSVIVVAGILVSPIIYIAGSAAVTIFINTYAGQVI
ncbi:uncharacterized protein Nmlp_3945 [Natronomonas moolapensis 8.8.11]|uniref:Yip1 domain-containing protein n=1 Tax=Natronomonas moolapensis (strain DSM 18674 / CECT 7526 / JCM 14361 / 8.8.11) TaxID=268739 RepID=M1XU51_NATM8|nr:uncharacterized protein Nmlp_3945 [Natronomonas moolapensis 8.8.11]